MIDSPKSSYHLLKRRGYHLYIASVSYDSQHPILLNLRQLRNVASIETSSRRVSTTRAPSSNNATAIARPIAREIPRNEDDLVSKF